LNLKNISEDILNSYRPIARQSHFAQNSEEDRPLAKLIETKTRQLNEVQKERIHQEFFNLGPLAPLMEKENLREILVQGKDHIFWEDHQGIHRWDDTFHSDVTFRNFVLRFCKKMQVIYSIETPFANGDYKSFRVHITAPPISKTVCLTMRRHQSSVLKLDSFLESEICSQNQLDQLKKMVVERSNFLIVGGTSSGKTTLLNSLIGEMKEDRIVAIEDTSELKLPNDKSVKMLTSGKNWSQEQLVQQSLRMRPDRIAMGEIRGGEAKDFLQALATGHRGSMGTLHSDGARQALYRLEMLVQMGCPQWGLESVRRLIQLSLDNIVVIQKKGNHREVEGIYKIEGLESFGFLVNRVDVVDSVVRERKKKTFSLARSMSDF